MGLDEKLEDAKRSLQIAAAAILVENYGKAKRMALKAQRLHPTDEAQSMLQDIEKLTSKNNELLDESHINIETAEMYLTTARIDMENDNPENAKKYLLRSLQLYPLDEAIDLFEKLKFVQEPDDLGDETRGTDEFIETGLLETRNKYIEEAECAFDLEDNNKALHLLIKSEHLRSCPEAKDLIERVKDKLLEKGEDPDKVMKEVRLSILMDAPELIKREVTEEQIKEIQRVLQAENDFDILGIPNESSLEEVEKAYRNLTKNMHPDKNKAPGAKEAFIKVKDARCRLKT